MIFSALPGKQGLYDPATEQDSCGVAVVVDIQGRRSHSIVTDGLTALTNLDEAKRLKDGDHFASLPDRNPSHAQGTVTVWVPILSQ